ncbi:MAG: hypothetical protein U0586_12020 [Candidatus Brocadiaceae bacterium]
MKTFAVFPLCVFLFYQCFSTTFAYSEEWSLEDHSWENKWGLDDQTPKHDKSDSIILHYDRKKWNKQKSDTNYLLLGLWGNREDNVYTVGINSNVHDAHRQDVSSGKK